ncbi:hypothetical protein [Paenibacillus sp. OV219]|uniref:hypothetical protein n=1 Tax=Paenibacillus sp. OV219 TaxID=1884377 RepID=UPI0008B9A951|nr:hypothetical protein [Paenibacillus sp. OV219]SEN21231.1 hypothetical protein SAMN05518847_102425 [Paenibacillus sp. OV219]
MSYPVIEQETTIVWEQATRLYTIYSTVPKHIRRLLKRAAMFEIKQQQVDEDGETFALKVRGSKLPPASTFN